MLAVDFCIPALQIEGQWLYNRRPLFGIGIIVLGIVEVIALLLTAHVVVSLQHLVLRLRHVLTLRRIGIALINAMFAQATVSHIDRNGMLL